MYTFYSLYFTIFCLRCLKLNVYGFIFNNSQVVGYNFMGLLIRQRNNDIDDEFLPAVLTFCTCIAVHKNWVLTSRQCFVQLEWIVHIVNDISELEMPKNNCYRIIRIEDNLELTMVKVDGIIDNHVQLALNKLPLNLCYLLSYVPTHRKLINISDPETVIYEVWKLVGRLEQIFVTFYRVKSTEKLYFETKNGNSIHPCAFDTGAAIICENYLQGVFINDQELPSNLPLYLPSACYDIAKKNNKITAINITENQAWILNTIAINQPWFYNIFDRIFNIKNNVQNKTSYCIFSEILKRILLPIYVIFYYLLY